jgi:ABC-type lipoprotein release transport system permease subunit
MNTFSMGWRNVWRQKRRSLVSIGAMAFALWTMILYSGLIRGMIQGMESSVLDLEVGEIQILAPGYLEKPSIWTAFEADGALLAALDDIGVPAAPRLLGGGLVAAGEASSGALLRGIDVARERRVSRMHEAVHSGAWLDPADSRGVVIGRRLAMALGVGVGGEILVLGQATDGSMANELYTVRGVLKAISDGTDRSALLMNAATFRELLTFPKGTHQVVARVPPGSNLEATFEQVRAVSPGLDVRTWRDLMPMVATMLESSRVMMSIVSLIMYLAVGILILNAMLMAVFERIREFGLLKALGVGPLRVLALILLESAYQIVIAVVLGIAAALPVAAWLATHGLNAGALAGADIMGVAMDPHWYGIYDVQSFAPPLVTLVVVVSLSVAYPALKAAWIKPISAMHHQ